MLMIQGVRGLSADATSTMTFDPGLNPFTRFTIKRLQAQINRWADSFQEAPKFLIVDGVLTELGARRALTVIEHGQILLGDQAGKAATEAKFASPVNAVMNDLSNTLSIVRAVSDADHKPAAAFVWPLSTGQTVIALGLVGIGGAWAYLRRR